MTVQIMRWTGMLFIPASLLLSFTLYAYPHWAERWLPVLMLLPPVALTLWFTAFVLRSSVKRRLRGARKAG